MSKSLAEKVGWLFENRRDQRGRQYSYGEVQRATGNRITASYVWKLRTGAMGNPGLGALEALSDVFHVPLSYFAEGGEYLEPSLSVMLTVRDQQVSRGDALELVEKSTGKLSDDKLRAVIEVVEYLGQQEALANR